MSTKTKNSPIVMKIDIPIVFGLLNPNLQFDFVNFKQGWRTHPLVEERSSPEPPEGKKGPAYRAFSPSCIDNLTTYCFSGGKIIFGYKLSLQSENFFSRYAHASYIKHTYLNGHYI